MAALLTGTGKRSRVGVRVVPVLVVLFALVMVLIVPDGRNGMLTLISVVALLLTWVAGSLIRERRIVAPIRRIGCLEAVVFVLVPTVTALMVSVDDEISRILQEETSTLEVRIIFATFVFGLQLVLLVTVYGVAALGLASAISSITRELFTSLGASGTVLARTLPLLLGVVTFIYVSGETWRTIGRVPMLGYIGVIGVLVLASGAFLLRREHLDLDGLARVENREELLASIEGIPLPAETVLLADDLTYPVTCPLTPYQDGTIRATAAMSHLVVTGLAGVAVSGFFLVLGFFGIAPDVV